MDKNEESYSIGLVTYVNRYYAFLKPTINSLIKNFPDKQIICVINGHPNKTKHIKYLREITNFLSNFSNIKYITWEDHQSLAKCWNWIVLMSSNSKILILNDDLLIKSDFRQSFKSRLNEKKDFFAINGSWSHFLVNKSLIKKVGWFDERFRGIGYEDGDYLLRMAQTGIKPVSLRCSGIENLVVPQDLDASYSQISSSEIINKYADVNYKFMGEKWHFNHIHGENGLFDISCEWNNEILKASLKKGMETPIFYEYSLLENFDMDFAPAKIKVEKKYLKKMTRKVIQILKNYVKF